jgi:Histone deacetylase domain
MANHLWCLGRVMYMSLHRGNGFYPNTGAATNIGSGAGQGFTVNVRLMLATRPASVLSGTCLQCTLPWQGMSHEAFLWHCHMVSTPARTCPSRLHLGVTCRCRG